jgi:flagellar motor switch protein FliN/FliY
MAELAPSAWLADEWARQLTGVLAAMTGDAPSITFASRELAAEELDPGSDDLFWWEQHFSLAPDALAWIGASTRTWQEIGNSVLRSAGVEDGDQENIRSTYLEIVNQTLSGLASAVSSRVCKEVSCTEGQPAAPTVSKDDATGSFEITLGELTLPLVAVFSSALTNLPDAPNPVPAAKPSPAAATDPAPAAKDSAPAAKDSAPAESQNNKSIDLLLDVELPVSISFGRAQLPLKDVIKLTTGSIVELNRALSEPVEVIVNNCVIARGEVVVVEGNYGIRIKQVISRQERLRTLS